MASTKTTGEGTERILRETMISAADVGRLFLCRNGFPSAAAKITRYILLGLHCPDGSRLKLEAHRIVGHWVCSTEAVERFKAARKERLGVVDCTAGTAAGGF